MLNTITKLHYEDKLPSIVNGALRNQLIRSYQLWVTQNPEMSQEDITDQWHPAIQWDKNENMIKEVEQDGTWDLQLNSDAVVYGIKQKKKLKESHKRSREDNETGIPYIHDDQTVIKKKKNIANTSVGTNVYTGLKWDSRNYSCAYDHYLLFCIIYGLKTHVYGRLN